ncbi:MAG: peptidylprolyl isomerase [Acidobacteria bacterium]|nr:peptidylprolyl isomerase [Acidobacteriota bacterium]
MKSRITIAVPGFLLLFAGFCFAQANAEAPASKNAIFPEIVARVNGEEIPGRILEGLVRQRLSTIGDPEWKNLRKDYRNELIQEFLGALVNSRLLHQKALAVGIKATDAEVQAEFQKVLKTFKNEQEMDASLAKQNIDRAAFKDTLSQNMTMSKYVAANVNKDITVTEEEIVQYYSSHANEVNRPELVRTSHILIQVAETTPEQDAEAKKKAEALLARAQKGEDFAALAGEYSADSSSLRGGDIGFNSKDALIGEFAEAAFSLPIGGMKLIRSSFGYHVIKVTDKRKRISNLEEAKPELAEFLKNEKAKANLDKLLNQLRQEAKIEILIPDQITN